MIPNNQELQTQTRKEHPILFNSEMVNAILSGRKTATRRIAKGALLKSPAGTAGDVLWVRETWMDLANTGIYDADGKPQQYAYGANCLPGSASDEARKDFGLKWKPSIHMPRDVCRVRPARPTKPLPWVSSSAPGASPITRTRQGRSKDGYGEG